MKSQYMKICKQEHNLRQKHKKLQYWQHFLLYFLVTNNNDNLKYEKKKKQKQNILFSIHNMKASYEQPHIRIVY